MNDHKLKVERFGTDLLNVDGRWVHPQDDGFWFTFGEMAQRFYETRGRVLNDIREIDDGKVTLADHLVGGMLYQVLKELKGIKSFAQSMLESPGIRRAMQLAKVKRERMARKIVRNRIDAAESIHGPMPANVRRNVRAKMRSDMAYKSMLDGDDWGINWIRLPVSIGSSKSKLQLAYVAWKKRRVKRKPKERRCER